MARRKAANTENIEEKNEKESAIHKKIRETCEIINKQIETRRGEYAVSFLGDTRVVKTPCFPTGSLSLDRSLGGGYPWGRIVEIFGPESCGKSTLCLHAIANVQRMFPDEMVAFVDAENALDVKYAKDLGVDVSTMLLSQPDSGEQAFNIVLALLKVGVKLIVVDSVAALAPEATVDEIKENAKIGSHAAMMSQGLRTLNAHIKVANATIIFTNQTRSKIGGYGGSTTTGGNALRFYSSQRLEVKRVGSDMVKDKSRGEDIPINNIIVVKVVKNKIAPPFLKATFKIRFGKGIDAIEQIIDIGLETGIIKKAGAWLSIVETEEKFQGKENLYKAIEENPVMFKELEEQIKESFGNIDVVKESTELQDAQPEEKEVAAKVVNFDIAEEFTTKEDEELEDETEEKNNDDVVVEEV